MSFGTSATVAIAGPRLRVRWLIFSLLFVLTIAAYVQRTAVSVAAERMMPELGLSQIQIGWLETAFLITYTALQFPGGVAGEFLGVRRMVALCAAVSVLATAAVPLLPSVATGTPLFLMLLLAQLTLGAAQAPFFGLLSGTLERWFPPHQWALTQGFSTSGVGLGGAAAPAMIATLMVAVGWRSALLAVALPVTLLVLAWWRSARDSPYQHPHVSAQELRELGSAQTAADMAPPTWRRLRALLLNRSLVALALSYAAMNFVFYLITFWSFLYLLQARHFTELDGGLAAALPPLGGAVGAAIGGIAGSHLTQRFGAARGLRIVPLIALPASGILLLLSVHTGSAAAALAGLTLAFGLIETTEASFWAASMEIGQQDAVASGGILNTGGNIGGIIATPLVAALSSGGNWTTPFVVGAICALLSAALWLLVRPTRCP